MRQVFPILIPVILIQAALFVSALTTLLQLYPLFHGRAYAIGSGLPMIMGISFAYVRRCRL